MQGYNALWLPGTDHAGIATQMVVERNSSRRASTRATKAPTRRRNKTLGREEFVAKVWEWKAESGGTIIDQMRRLGASSTGAASASPWTRACRGRARGLRRSLRRQGLIYRAKRLVNWSPVLTAISDLEVESREVRGELWYFALSARRQRRAHRRRHHAPETMLGDTAVAVHPDDRYKHLIGKHAILPLVGRRIPIVADEYADPENGTGAVKVTPAHDFNDFEIGQRHNLEAINIFDKFARLNDKAPEKFAASTASRRASGSSPTWRRWACVEKIEPHTHAVPSAIAAACRSSRAVRAVVRRRQDARRGADRGGARRPRRLRPRARARRLLPLDGEHRGVVHLAPAVVGPPIPAWYGPDEQGLRRRCGGRGAGRGARSTTARTCALEHDPDVLDTWFSLGAVAVLDAGLAGPDAGARRSSIRPACW